MNVFVTGATGYIGSAVADRFVHNGHRVTGLARTAEAADRLRSRQIIPVFGKLHEPERLKPFCKEADAIIHTAFQWGVDVRETIKAEQAIVAALLAGIR